MTDSEQFKLERQRVLFTMGIAGIVVVGGMAMIGLLLWAGIISGETGVAVLIAIITGALTWLFTKDASKDGAKSQQEASAQGAAQALSPYPSAPPPEEVKEVKEV